MSTIRRSLSVLGATALMSASLLGCHDSDNLGNNDQPPAGSQVAFEPYAQSLVNLETCTANTPVETNDLNFTFSSNQDMEEPKSTDAIMQGCNATS
jgi:hypothetical protein